MVWKIWNRLSTVLARYFAFDLILKLFYHLIELFKDETTSFRHDFSLSTSATAGRPAGNHPSSVIPAYFKPESTPQIRHSGMLLAGIQVFELVKEGLRHMLNLDERFIIDDKGNRISVILDISNYQKLIADLEELESIRAFDALENP